MTTKLINEIEALKKSLVKKTIECRLREFGCFRHKSTKEWFSELCFCLLTANSKAQTAIQIQKDLGATGFCHACFDDVRQCIITNKHRFHNNKSKYIVEARAHIDIKEKITDIVLYDGEKEAREWLVKNIKGLGYKEAAHFMRNVGYTKLAILDRHILRLMHECGYIKTIPKTLSKNIYLEIEKKFNNIAKKFDMNSAELDLYMWYLKTGKILK